MGKLNDIPIRTKIWGGFLGLQAFLILIAAIATLRFSGLQTDIAEYQDIATDAGKVSEITADAT